MNHNASSKDLKRTGFTLIEVSTAMSLMVILSGVLVMMLQQHLSFMSMTAKQSFLVQQAPQIGNILGRIFQQADHYFVYGSRDAALEGADPIIQNGRAVCLFFKTAIQTTQERMIAAELTDDGRTSLRFYAPQPDGTETSWTICRNLQGASFSADEGILKVTLIGPNGEEITYCGSPR